MSKEKTSVFANGLIWFGAAVSIAEIVTGTLFAPLGFVKGLLAILTGHIIGCGLLFFSGLIGGKTGKCAMETTRMSFGKKGSLIFVVLNIIQLVGWTAIMIYDGALAANGAWDIGSWIWALLIGSLVVLWISVGIKNLGKINTVSMIALTVLTCVLSFVIFSTNITGMPVTGSLSFGAAVELSVAMPLSWLPLISDYTKDAEKPVKATLISAVVYGVVSAWMYVIGMGAAIFTGSSDIADVMVKAGLGIAALLIIVLSTVTTTFLDAYSAGVSGEVLSKKIKGKWVAVGTAVIGTLGAICFPMTDITDFLYLIGSVFAPMIAIQIADFYILKKDSSNISFDYVNLVVWVVGFITYRLLMKIDIVTGSTLPDMVITIGICCVVDRVRKSINKR